MSEVTDVRVRPVRYWASEGQCVGTNVTFAVDGVRYTSRLPWVATEAEARARIESHIKAGLIGKRDGRT